MTGEKNFQLETAKHTDIHDLANIFYWYATANIQLQQLMQQRENDKDKLLTQCNKLVDELNNTYEQYKSSRIAEEYHKFKQQFGEKQQAKVRQFGGLPSSLIFFISFIAIYGFFLHDGFTNPDASVFLIGILSLPLSGFLGLVVTFVIVAIVQSRLDKGVEKINSMNKNYDAAWDERLNSFDFKKEMNFDEKYEKINAFYKARYHDINNNYVAPIEETNEVIIRSSEYVPESYRSTGYLAYMYDAIITGRIENWKELMQDLKAEINTQRIEYSLRELTTTIKLGFSQMDLQMQNVYQQILSAGQNFHQFLDIYSSFEKNRIAQQQLTTNQLAELSSQNKQLTSINTSINENTNTIIHQIDDLTARR